MAFLGQYNSFKSAGNLLQEEPIQSQVDRRFDRMKRLVCYMYSTCFGTRHTLYIAEAFSAIIRHDRSFLHSPTSETREYLLDTFLRNSNPVSYRLSLSIQYSCIQHIQVPPMFPISNFATRKTKERVNTGMPRFSISSQRFNGATRINDTPMSTLAEMQGKANHGIDRESS